MNEEIAENQSKTHSAADVARYIVNHSIEKNGCVYTAMVQAMTVIVQYESLFDRGEPMFVEPIVYKKYGARIEGLTREYRTVMYDPIKSHQELKFSEKSFDVHVVDIPFDENMFSEYDKNLMNRVIDNFSDNNFVSLSPTIENYSKWLQQMEEQTGVRYTLFEDKQC